MRHFAVLAALLAIFGLMGLAPALAQTPTTVALPPADSVAGEWLLSGAELVTVTISANGVVTGTYVARDFADGAADRYPVAGAFDGRELRLAIVGTAHPGYILRRLAPDTFVGHLAGFTDEVTLNRRLAFTGQDPI
ncbi:hypothetical protein HY504_03320 [Candidatus Wolfebacteria bacterium]|nr:hypothetical protein [Candidatus Wolfebacteria bacterium]